MDDTEIMRIFFSFLYFVLYSKSKQSLFKLSLSLNLHPTNQIVQYFDQIIHIHRPVMNHQPLLPLYENETSDEVESRRQAQEYQAAQPNPTDDPITAMRKWFVRNSRTIKMFCLIFTILFGMMAVYESNCFAENAWHSFIPMDHYQEHRTGDVASNLLRDIDLVNVRHLMSGDDSKSQFSTPDNGEEGLGTDTPDIGTPNQVPYTELKTNLANPTNKKVAFTPGTKFIDKRQEPLVDDITDAKELCIEFNKYTGQKSEWRGTVTFKIGQGQLIDMQRLPLKRNPSTVLRFWLTKTKDGIQYTFQLQQDGIIVKDFDSVKKIELRKISDTVQYTGEKWENPVEIKIIPFSGMSTTFNAPGGKESPTNDFCAIKELGDFTYDIDKYDKSAEAGCPTCAVL